MMDSCLKSLLASCAGIFAGIGLACAASVPVTDGLVVCLDASNLVGLEDGASVTEWLDASGSGNNALAPDGKAPTFHANAVNGLPAVYFGGANTMYVGYKPTGDMTVFIVTQGSRYWSMLRWQGGVATGGGAFFYGHPSLGVASEWNGGFNIRLPLNLAANAWNISSGVFAINVENGVEVFSNGASNGTVTWASGITGCSHFYICSGSGTGEYGIADVAEILVYDRALNALERSLVGGYLENKYGIAGDYPNFVLANPISGSIDYTGTNELDVVWLPTIADGSEYQFTTFDASPDDGSWQTFDADNPFTSVILPAPDHNCDWPINLFVRNRVGGEWETASYYSSIEFVTEAPTVVARENVSFVVNRFVGREIAPSEIDGGTRDDLYGLASLAVSPTTIGLGEQEVTLSAVNNAGISASATVTVTGVAGECRKSGVVPVTQGLRLHLDASALTGYAANDPVEVWPDSSGNGRDAYVSSTTAPVYHPNAANGHAAVYFGGNKGMFVDDMHPDKDMSIFVVTKGANYQSLLRYQNGGNTFFYGWGNWCVCSEANGFVNSNNINFGLVANEWNISAGLFAVGVEDGVRVYRNNELQGARTWNNALTGQSVISIASASGASEFANCEIAEILIYDRALTDEEHAAVGSFLQHKYGMASNVDPCYQELVLANPVTGSTEFTSVPELDVLRFPYLPEGAEYQFTTSANSASLDDGAWRTYDVAATPATFAFEAPAADGPVTIVLWSRTWKDGVASISSVQQTIEYSTSAPTAAAKNISLDIDTTRGTAVPADLLDDGSSDNVSGIFALYADPATITAGGQVELVVVNNAGVSARATANITLANCLDAHVSPDGDDANGTGSINYPWRTITHALENVVAGGTVYAAPGTYNAGEGFPISVASDASIAAEPGASSLPAIDGGNDVTHLFNVSDGATLSLDGLALRETTDAAINLTSASAVIKGCAFTQSVANDAVTTDWRFGYYGAIKFNGGATASIEDSTFENIKRFGVLYAVAGANTVSLKGCRFAGNISRGGMIGGIPAQLDVSMVDCDFISNDTFFKGGLSQCSYCAVANLEGMGTLFVDRCRFLGNGGANLIGIANSSSASICNSLFAGNTSQGGLFQGLGTTLSIRNSTFVKNAGGYSSNGLTTKLYNCILCGETAMNVTNGNTLNRSNPSGTTLFDCIFWDCGNGDGWGEAASRNIIREDPKLANIAVIATDPAFDARPLPYSPALDAGVFDSLPAECNALDIDGNARVADNDCDGVARIDIGCYESLFGSPIGPTFQVPAPGLVSGLYGTTATVPVSVWPPVEGPVTASISYTDGVSGPATLSIPDGAGPVDLEVAISSTAVDGDFARVTIADSASPAAIAPVTVDFSLADARVNIGHSTLVYVRAGESVTLPVSIELAGATAPADLPVSITSVSGDGENSISWSGAAKIAAGASATEGGLAVTGVDGIDVVTVSVGGGYFFAESGEDSVEVTVVGYPGWMAVDPESGDDTLLIGTLDAPFQSVTRALSILRGGDEVRLLPGAYTAATETFPWKPANVALVGYDVAGDASPTNHIVDGGNNVASLIDFDGVSVSVTDGFAANLALRETTGAALAASAANVAVSNLLFTQSVTNTAVAGGIVLKDNATVAAYGCVFSGIPRIATVLEDSGTLNDNNRFTGVDCVFENNYSAYGTVSCATDVAGHYSMTGCDFLGNSTPLGPRWYEVWPDTGIQVRNGGSFEAVRCRFMGGNGGAVLGTAYGNSTCRDCLFAQNTCAAGMAQGCGWGITYVNCTMVGNTGGYNSGFMTATFINSIICGDGALSVMPKDEWMRDDPMSFQNTIIWDTPVGRDVATMTFTDAIDKNPLLRNVAVAWDDPAFDARVRSGSPAIDAGLNAQVTTAIDLDGSARIKAGAAGHDAIVDLGCYEADKVNLGTLFLVK